jgi:hypothetical protein
MMRLGQSSLLRIGAIAINTFWNFGLISNLSWRHGCEEIADFLRAKTPRWTAEAMGGSTLESNSSNSKLQ